jgi:hypothetical protein
MRCEGVHCLFGRRGVFGQRGVWAFIATHPLTPERTSATSLMKATSSKWGPVLTTILIHPPHTTSAIRTSAIFINDQARRLVRLMAEVARRPSTADVTSGGMRSCQ